MSFLVDAQTLKDLNILGKFNPASIFSLFNTVKTSGGEKMLEQMFRFPLTDASLINKRSRLFRYFQELELTFNFEKTQIEIVENYLSESGSNLFSSVFEVLRKKGLELTVGDKGFEQMVSGLSATRSFLDQFGKLVFSMGELKKDSPYYHEISRIKGILANKGFQLSGNPTKLALMEIARLNFVFRGSLAREIRELMDIFYELDVLVAVGRLASEKDFGYANALKDPASVLALDSAWHPRVAKAVANTLILDGKKNVLFLTGANMAGKSTLMKTVGVALYLAHLGFPIAAKSMEFSVRDGLFTSINVPDDISLGHSHFYAEVLRVKRVAEEVASGKNLLVIFDELFKGTNVKDAFDATLAVSKAFADYSNNAYIISTHIIEVGEELRACKNIQFQYLPTVMDGLVPRYTYTLKEGITTDRQGMMIIENERILEIIRGERIPTSNNNA